MDAFFDKVQEYIDAAKAKAKDIAEKGADALDELAGWLRSQAHAPVGAAPTIDTTRLATLQSECQALAVPVTGAKGGTPAPVGGPFGGLLAKLIAAILAALK